MKHNKENYEKYKRFIVSGSPSSKRDASMKICQVRHGSLETEKIMHTGISNTNIFHLMLILLALIFLSGCIASRFSLNELGISTGANPERIFAGENTQLYVDVENNGKRTYHDVSIDVFDTGIMEFANAPAANEENKNDVTAQLVNLKNIIIENPFDKNVLVDTASEKILDFNNMITGKSIIVISEPQKITDYCTFAGSWSDSEDYSYIIQCQYEVHTGDVRIPISVVYKRAIITNAYGQEQVLEDYNVMMFAYVSWDEIKQKTGADYRDDRFYLRGGATWMSNDRRMRVNFLDGRIHNYNVNVETNNGVPTGRVKLSPADNGPQVDLAPTPNTNEMVGTIKEETDNCIVDGGCMPQAWLFDVSMPSNPSPTGLVLDEAMRNVDGIAENIGNKNAMTESSVTMERQGTENLITGMVTAEIKIDGDRTKMQLEDIFIVTVENVELNDGVIGHIGIYKEGDDIAVDTYESTINGNTLRKYIYIDPKKYSEGEKYSIHIHAVDDQGNPIEIAEKSPAFEVVDAVIESTTEATQKSPASTTPTAPTPLPELDQPPGPIEVNRQIWNLCEFNTAGEPYKNDLNYYWCKRTECSDPFTVAVQGSMHLWKCLEAKDEQVKNDIRGIGTVTCTTDIDCATRTGCNVCEKGICILSQRLQKENDGCRLDCQCTIGSCVPDENDPKNRKCKSPDKPDITQCSNGKNIDECNGPRYCDRYGYITPRCDICEGKNRACGGIDKCMSDGTCGLQCSKKFAEILPNQKVNLECNLKSPAMNNLLKEQTQSEIHTKITYKDKISIYQPVTFMSREEFMRRQEAGISYPKQSVYNYQNNDLSVKISFSEDIPIVSKGQNIYMYIDITDIGSGFAHPINLYEPGRFEIDISDTILDGYIANACGLNKRLIPRNKVYPQITCKLKNPSDINYLNTFMISININYIYELRNSAV